MKAGERPSCPWGRVSSLRLGALAILVSATGFLWPGMASAARAAATNAPIDFSAPPIDASFTNGLAAVKSYCRFQEIEPTAVFPEWRTNLSLILGFRIDSGASRFVNLIEITTLPPSLTNAPGKPAAPPAATFSVRCENSTLCSTARVYRFTSPRYPVRVRVFDEHGRFLKESRDAFAWNFLTNGLADACRLLKATTVLSDAFYDTAKRGGAEDLLVLVRTNELNSLLLDVQHAEDQRASPTPPMTLIKGVLLEVERRSIPAVTTLVGLFGDTLACGALEDVRDHAMAVVRPPSILKTVFNLGLNLNLNPQFQDCVVFPNRSGTGDERQVLFPAQLDQGKRLLVSVDFIAGSTKGPYFLTGGVRAIRAVHPTKPDHRLLAQVLAAGTAGSTTPSQP